MKSWTKAILSLALLSPLICAKALWPKPSSGSFNIEDFTFDSGEIIDSLNISYQTLGELKVNSDGSNNAVVLLHGTTGSSAQFLVEEFAGALFNPGQPLDANEYFIIMRDAIGHGNSSKPSNTGLRASFPKYQYPDMIRADHFLLTEHFKLNRTRLTLGVSMGAWKGGDYEKQPAAGLGGALMIQLVLLSSPSYWQRAFPTREAVNNYTYNPKVGLKNIRVPLTAVNTADDLLNPIELGFLEDGVANDMTPGYGRAVTIPASNETTGHDSYIMAVLWKIELEKLLARSAA
ncbi:Putative homoserine O-acetyltransferase [Fusarium odoratissimum]|uniref:Putative homoserine O-acetyltransferase n=1 Tax=Fusarium oxysporum f. sp. cubense (strain race 4) TaxID=2502994 RepID=N1RGH3_FUSC4|nr:Putative homoserine O-acetyltransferase [Fusarium odoratissimum]